MNRDRRKVSERLCLEKPKQRKAERDSTSNGHRLCSRVSQEKEMYASEEKLLPENRERQLGERGRRMEGERTS